MKIRSKFSPLIVAAILLIALLALAVNPSHAAAAPDLSLDWRAVGFSGSMDTAGSLTLYGFVGQSIARMPNPHLCAGFGCGLVTWFQNHLPAIYH